VHDTLRVMNIGFNDERSLQPHIRFLNTRSFGSLDGLRAAAILAVLWHHAAGRKALDLLLARRGFLGVDLFFVISGFLIVTLLLRERRRSGQVSLRRFYARRFLRIFPVYYAFLVFVGVVALMRHSDGAALLKHDLPYALLYVSNMVPMASFLAVTWSLSAEEQFYLVVPTLEKLAPKYLACLLPASYVLFSLPPFGFFRGWNLPSFFRGTTFGPILLGVMLAHILDHPRGYHWLWRLLSHKWSPVFAAVITLLACAHPSSDISGWPRMAIDWTLLLLVASCVIREEHALNPVLTFWPIRRIGVVSYGIYLFHHPMLHLVQMGLGHLGVVSAIFSFVTLCSATWGIAELSYRLYESRFLAMKDRLAR